MVHQGHSQGKGNRMTISRMIGDLPPTSFEKCGEKHHSNRKEKTLLPAPGMTARGQLASLPPQVRAGSRNVRTDLPRRFATAASIDQILISYFPLWSCRFRGVCFAFSFCCGAFDFRLSVFRVSPCCFLKGVLEGSPSLLVVLIRTIAKDVFELASQPIPIAFAGSSIPEGLERKFK